MRLNSDRGVHKGPQSSKELKSGIDHLAHRTNSQLKGIENERPHVKHYQIQMHYFEANS